MKRTHQEALIVKMVNDLAVGEFFEDKDGVEELSILTSARFSKRKIVTPKTASMLTNIVEDNTMFTLINTDTNQRTTIKSDGTGILLLSDAVQRLIKRMPEYKSGSYFGWFHGQSSAPSAEPLTDQIGEWVGHPFRLDICRALGNMTESTGKHLYLRIENSPLIHIATYTAPFNGRPVQSPAV